MNPLIGGFATPLRAVESDAEEIPETVTADVDGNILDRTEYVVAAFVLAALGVLIVARLAGFQAVLATRVSVGT